MSNMLWIYQSLGDLAKLSIDPLFLTQVVFVFPWRPWTWRLSVHEEWKNACLQSNWPSNGHGLSVILSQSFRLQSKLHLEHPECESIPKIRRLKDLLQWTISVMKPGVHDEPTFANTHAMQGKRISQKTRWLSHYAKKDKRHAFPKKTNRLQA